MLLSHRFCISLSGNIQKDRLVLKGIYNKIRRISCFKNRMKLLPNIIKAFFFLLKLRRNSY